VARDNSPVGATCSSIDSVISFLNNIDCEDVSSQSIKDIIDCMEEIRNANSKLRDWGNEEYDRAEVNENEKNEWEDRYNEVQREIENLNDKIIDLNDEINSITS